MIDFIDSKLYNMNIKREEMLRESERLSVESLFMQLKAEEIEEAMEDLIWHKETGYGKDDVFEEDY